MVSTLKSETARINGAKSRGPTTAEGKEKSSRNALQHGLCADGDTVLLECEDPAQYNGFLVKLRRIHEPATPAEEDVFEEMVVARWRLRRMRTIELGLLDAEVLAQQSTSDSPKPTAHLALAFRALADDSRSLALASRYEARLQRLYERAHKTLREMQQARLSQPAEPHPINIQWIDPPEPELPNEPTVAANKQFASTPATIPQPPVPTPAAIPQPPAPTPATIPQPPTRDGEAPSVSAGAPDASTKPPTRSKT
jgi:hypothetical protein